MLSPHRADGSPGASTRRTNSLAFAKSDCHTCVSRGLHCDRQRPRCTICQDSGRLCNGYSMQLSWQRSHSAANRPPKVKAAAPPQNNGTTAGRSGRLDTEVSPSNETPKPRASGPREFTFIAGRSAKRRKRHHASDAIAECSDSLSNELPISPGSSTWSQSSMSNRSISKLVTSSPFPRPDPTTEPETYRHRKALRTRLWQPIQEIVCEPDVDSPSDESLEQGLELQHYKYAPTIPSPSMSGSTNDSWAGCPSPELAYYASLSFIPQLCFATLHDKFSGLLDMCMSIAIPVGRY